MLTGGEHGLLFMGRGGRDSIYLGRVAYENVVAHRLGLVSSRRSTHLLRTVALPSIYSNLPLFTYYLGTTPSYSLNVLFS